MLAAVCQQHCTQSPFACICRHISQHTGSLNFIKISLHCLKVANGLLTDFVTYTITTKQTLTKYALEQ